MIDAAETIDTMVKELPPMFNALVLGSAIALRVSNDIHTIHLNLTGVEFDTLHKEVLKKYYEEAAEDYDTISEWARCYGVPVPYKNMVVGMLPEQTELDADTWDRCSCVVQMAELLSTICDCWTELYRIANADNSGLAVGIANTAQTRLEYWYKEYLFFNQSRG